MEVNINFDQLRTLRGQLAQSPEVVREELTTAVTEADVVLLNAMKTLTPKASGTLRQSEMHEERVTGLGVEGFVGSPLNYLQPVDLGTRPHFPPLAPLIDWVKVKFGVQDEKQARGIAFLVARKIAAKGTQGAQVVEQTFEAMLPTLDAIFAQAQTRIIARLQGAS